MTNHTLESVDRRHQAHADWHRYLLAQITLGFVALLLAGTATAVECPGTPRTVVGTVYCDNLFTLWVNGRKVASDPVAFTPHQAVHVAFEWNGASSLTYAIQCEDYASESGYEYTGSNSPQLGDGALIAAFEDGLGTVTTANWRVYTATFGPTDASRSAGCSADNLDSCVVENRGMPEGWTQPDFDDSSWAFATPYSAAEAGWGRRPTWSSKEGCCTLTSPVDRSSLGCDRSLQESECLDPRVEFAGSSAGFIWAADLERDNRVLFRYTASCATASP